MLKIKKKILILFEGPHIAYSPTVIQLFDFLDKEYDVYIYIYSIMLNLKNLP